MSAPGEDRDDPTQENGCAALVALAAREALPGIGARRFIRRLGHAGAGVRPGLVGLVDLALAGRNTLPGHGFRPELDDGTAGQARHFCGIVDACDRFGPTLTRWISIHVRRDAPDTPDGRLTDIAIEFVGRLDRGELAPVDAAAWLRRTLCDPASVPEPEDSAPPAAHA